MEIGFLDESTTEMFYREARDLLVEVTRTLPFTLSYIVKIIDDLDPSSKGLKRLVYVCKALVFDDWEPRIADIETIMRWLRSSPLESCHSHLARMLITNMDWSVSFNRQLNCLQRKYPRDLHVSLCLCIVETYLDSNSLVRSPSTSLTEGFRQVSSLAANRKTPLQAFCAWAWETVSRLHLHVLDQHKPYDAKLLDQSMDYHDFILDLDLNPLMERTVEGVVAKNPMACYAALQLSQTGHLVNDVCERGIHQLKVLTQSGHYDHVMECLANMIPLFINHQNVNLLCQSNDFLSTIETVINADQTYLKMAKDLILKEFPGPVLKEFRNMVTKQLSCHHR